MLAIPPSSVEIAPANEIRHAALVGEPTKRQSVVLHEQDCPLESWSESRDRVVWRTLFSGDRTPTEGLTVGVAELAPTGEREVLTHRHAPPEVYYVLAGQGVVFVDEEQHALRPGSVVFVPADAEHAAANTGAEPLRLLYVFPTDSFDEVEYHFSEEPWSIG